MYHAEIETTRNDSGNVKLPKKELIPDENKGHQKIVEH